MCFLALPWGEHIKNEVKYILQPEAHIKNSARTGDTMAPPGAQRLRARLELQSGTGRREGAGNRRLQRGERWRRSRGSCGRSCRVPRKLRMNLQQLECAYCICLRL